MRNFSLTLWLVMLCCSPATQAEPTNLNALPNDLTVPAVVTAPPAAGTRVWQQASGYADWDVAYAIYLPRDWEPGKRYPVLFEYPGNGGYTNDYGDRSDGRVEDCRLGYGLTAGEGSIWVSLPFLDPQNKAHARNWWGDPELTADYCLHTQDDICQKFGGDPERFVLCGFSRGAIACNYIGLRTPKLASRWRAFMIHSHYDGVRRWNYIDSDLDSARVRLARLGQRPQWISHEQSIAEVRDYLNHEYPAGNFRFVPIPFSNHSADWVLKDLPERAVAREWLREVLK